MSDFRGEDLVMSWGVHRGSKICDLPGSYISWALQQDWLPDALREEMENQLALRRGEGVRRTR